MKRGFVVILSVVVLLAISGNLSAQESLIETVATGCKTEITTYCKDVKPGEGRVLACLYAHEDKLSGKCEYALYDAAAKAGAGRRPPSLTWPRNARRTWSRTAPA